MLVELGDKLECRLNFLELGTDVGSGEAGVERGSVDWQDGTMQRQTLRWPC